MHTGARGPWRRGRFGRLSWGSLGPPAPHLGTLGSKLPWGAGRAGPVACVTLVLSPSLLLGNKIFLKYFLI